MIQFRKIRHRVFFSIFVTLSLLITGILIFQLLYFENWYLDRKKDRLETMVQATSERLRTYDYGDVRLRYDIHEFEEATGAVVSLFHKESGVDLRWVDSADELSEMMYDLTFIVKDEGDRFYYMPILAAVGGTKWTELFPVGSQMMVAGETLEDIIHPSVVGDYTVDSAWMPILDTTTQEAEVLPEDGLFYEEEVATPFEGMVTVMEIQSGLDQRQSFGLSGYDRADVTGIGEGFESYTFKHPFTDTVSIVYIKEVVMVDGTEAVMYVEVSLQTVEEAMNAVAPFFILFYGIAFVAVLLLAGYISGKITGPIVAMTLQAEKMADEDFSGRVVVTTEDELGQLGISINRMTDNLEASMAALKSANQELLVEIDKERSREARQRSFMANASHELKTPLGIARGYLEAIQDGIHKEKHGEYMAIAIGEMDRMNRIVLNMLEVMKLEEKGQLTLKPASLVPFVHEMALFFDMTLQERAMNLRLDMADVPVLLEPTTTRSLLMNLISNAITYGVAGTEVVVASRGQGTGVKLTVSNAVADGEAIDMTQIWHKFYTVDKSHNRGGSGTGLGLSIVKGILEQYGATYEANLRDGRFVFECYLKGEEV